MSEDTVHHCLNIGCRETFKHWTPQSRDLEKGCKGTPKEKSVEKVVKSGTGYVCKICSSTLNYVCKICSSTLKHQNNVKRHKKYCIFLDITKKWEYLCSFSDTIFIYKSKLTEHMVMHSKKRSYMSYLQQAI